VKFVAIADTHGKHKELSLPAGDVLIHAGDISMKGDESEILDFLDWFKDQKHQYKVLVAGNHDFYFEREAEKQIQKIIPQNIIYLNDSGTTINGINIWGSPITPWFFNWAFNRHRGEPIKRHWDLIPHDTDILITHGPVLKILDKTIKNQYAGCEDLLNKIRDIMPKVHICGHIHEAYGAMNHPEIKFINASVLNEKYELKNDPIVFEIR
jgi:Icc-related predicted phosphoesterase